MSALSVKECYSGANNNEELLQYLQRAGHLKSEYAYYLMLKCDRQHFVGNPTLAYIDMPIAAGYSETIMAPHMYAIILDLLSDKLQSGGRALDIDSNTGYLAVCFAEALGESGSVISVTGIKGRAHSTLSYYYPHLLDRLEFINENKDVNHLSKGPYDIIHVGSAIPDIPKNLLKQLSPSGQLIVPIETYCGVVLTSFKKGLDGKIEAAFHLYVKCTHMADHIIPYLIGDAISRNSSECETTILQLTNTLNKFNEELIEQQSADASDLNT